MARNLKAGIDDQYNAPAVVKRVLVLDGHNESVPLIQGAGLERAESMKQFRFDSEALSRVNGAMLSHDGIQFYHFPQKYSATNPGHFIGFEHIERHLEILEKQFAQANKSISNPEKKKKLDAIVIPDGMLEKPATLKWLESVTARWPDLKILVTNPIVHPRTEPMRDDVYVQALNDPIHSMYTDPLWSVNTRSQQPYQEINANNPHYKVALPNMVLTPNLLHAHDHMNVLRRAMGMEMQEQRKGTDKPGHAWNR